MNTNTKSWWSKLCEFFVRARPDKSKPALPATEVPLDWPPLDPEKNDETLVNLKDSDPSYQMLMSYGRVHVENLLVCAMDPAHGRDRQWEFFNQAIGVKDWMADVENTRQKLVQEKIDKQRREEKRAK